LIEPCARYTVSKDRVDTRKTGILWDMPLRWIVIATSIFAATLSFCGPTRGLCGGEVSESRRTSAEPGAGTVEGTVFYRNDRRHAWRLARYYVKSSKTGELAEAVVALVGPSLRRIAGPRQPAVVSVDQKEMRFVPETVAIRTGDRVRFTNSDPQTHNISLDDPRMRFSDTIAKGRTAVESFVRPSGVLRPFALSCKFHSQMQGWIYVFDHPFYRVTHADGRFRWENVPPGDYRLDVAHAAGELHASRVVHVKPHETVNVDLILTPADRPPAE
jgi:plastocyanin